MIAEAKVSAVEPYMSAGKIIGDASRSLNISPVFCH